MDQNDRSRQTVPPALLRRSLQSKSVSNPAGPSIGVKIFVVHNYVSFNSSLKQDGFVRGGQIRTLQSSKFLMFGPS